MRNVNAPAAESAISAGVEDLLASFLKRLSTVPYSIRKTFSNLFQLPTEIFG